MTTKAKTTKSTPRKRSKPKTKATNGHVPYKREDLLGDEPAPTLATLPRPERKDVQETFRCTATEHAGLVSQARDGGFTSMGRFYRAKLGLSG